MGDHLEDLLHAVRKGDVSVADAARALSEGHLPGGKGARIDFRRMERTGLPEIILAEGKDPEDLRKIVEELSRAHQEVIISRVSGANRRLLERLASAGIPLTFPPRTSLALLRGQTMTPLQGRVVAVLTAGTADLSVAEEAAIVLSSLGAEVVRAYDIGVAGLHRLTRALADPAVQRAQVFVVCAGREGALPTVVAGLVDRPIVAIPTSVGYGRGAKGEGALTAMLQSCAPLAVVNIDGGVPAALVAAQILRHLPPAGKKRRGPTKARAGR
ncbi:MAG: nickel pincer cofactor biosynthesis protein LarB [Candidatus Thermoplasmatota archaeon]|jgi:NCAIR mutase (PurE)-related protein|nr:nickel pincer cofactor biosynthesis protein LarB [Candidatus Thermoplasmatota archaeon]